MNVVRRAMHLAGVLVACALLGCAPAAKPNPAQQAAPKPVPFVRAQHLCANLEPGKTDLAAVRKDLAAMLTNVPGKLFVANGKTDFLLDGIEAATDEGIRANSEAGFKYRQLMNLPLGYREKETPAGYPQGVQVWGVFAMFIVDKELTKCVFDELGFIQREMRKRYEDGEMADFLPHLAEYRALKTKPAVSEAQRKFIVQANSWSEKKRYDMALEVYKQALGVDPFSYPAAYYNMALLYAQEGEYMAAIVSMKKYLLLVPEAGDARTAQDKIYEWEGTAGVQ